MTILKREALRALTSMGLRCRPRDAVRPNPIQPWSDDPRFAAIMRRVEGHTLVDVVRCYMLYQFALHAAPVPGDVAEVGVYKGGTARLLAETIGNSDKRIHLFDTFSGMPPADPRRDIHREGDFSDTSLDDVKSYLGEFLNIRYYKGLFPDTAGGITGEAFSLVHVDADLYRSVRDCLEFFYPRMSAGGIMVFDDYGFLTCPGAKEAVDEYFKDRAESPVYMPTGQCFIVRHRTAATCPRSGREVIL